MIWDNSLDKNSAACRFAADDSKTIRVVTGSGTGKAFGLNRRVARLLEQGQDPRRILAEIFTRTAVQDLKKEIQSIGISGSEQVTAKTLHSFCFSLLNSRGIIESTGRFPRPMLECEQKPMLYDISRSLGNLKEKTERMHAFEAAWARLQSEEPGFPLEEIDRQFEGEILSWLKSHKSMKNSPKTTFGEFSVS